MVQYIYCREGETDGGREREGEREVEGEREENRERKRERDIKRERGSYLCFKGLMIDLLGRTLYQCLNLIVDILDEQKGAVYAFGKINIWFAFFFVKRESHVDSTAPGYCWIKKHFTAI